MPESFIYWMNHWNIGEEDVVHGPMCVVYLERKHMLNSFWRFYCHFDAYSEGLINPIEICGSMIMWVS